MGQTQSGDDMGRLGKKGQIAPSGPSPPPRSTNSSTSRQPERPTPVIGKQYPTYLFTTVIVSFPMTCFLIFAALPFLLSCVTLFDSEGSKIDTMLESFEITDHSTVMKRDVSLAATEDWKTMLEAFRFGGDDRGFEKTEPEPNSIPWKRIYIQYEVPMSDYIRAECSSNKDGAFTNFSRNHNILTVPEYLKFIRDLEWNVEMLPMWRELCFRSDKKANNPDFKRVYTADAPSSKCAPFTSFIQYYYPGGVFYEEYEREKRRLFWTFRTEDAPYTQMQGPPDKVLDLYYQNPAWKWFGDAGNSPTNRMSLLLRTQITIGRPILGVEDSTDAEARVNKFMKYLTEYLDRVLDHMNADYTNGIPPGEGIGSFPEGLTFTYGGDNIMQSLLGEAQQADWWHVFGGVLLVLIITGLYTHSYFIATMSIGQLMLSFGTGMFIMRYSTNEPLSLLSLLSFYILMGMSCDGVLVYFNTFRQSAFMETNGRKNMLTMPERLAYCYRKAGAAITVTHFAAGIAFAVNSVSTVPAIRTFGLFMMALSFINAYMFLTVFPCLLIIHHYHISKKRRNAQRQTEVMLRRQVYHPPVLRNAIRRWETLGRKNNGSPTIFMTDIRSMRMQQDQMRQMRALPVNAAGGTDEFPSAAGSSGNAEQETKVQVTREATGAFQGIKRLHAKWSRKRPPPKSPEELKKEQEALFNQFSGGSGLTKSRRKPPATLLMHIPVEYTSLGPGGRTRVVATPQGYENPGAEEVEMDDYAKYREMWEDEARSQNVGIASVWGPGTWVDPRSQQPLDAKKRVPIVIEQLFEHNELRIVRGVNTEDDATDTPPAADADAANGDGNALAAGAAGGAVAGGAIGNDHARPTGRLGSGPETAPPPKRDGCCGYVDTVKAWWVERGKVRRRFGRFGKRVGETREEKDRRIMGKAAKRETYTALERAFYNQYAPFLAKAYPFILLAYLIKFIVFAAVLLPHIETTSQRPKLLSYENNLVRYEEAQKRFPVSGSCDYCGPWFRPYTDFPAPFGGYPGTANWKAVDDLAACGYQMHEVKDECGVCGGDNSCLDCIGQKSQCFKLRTKDACVPPVADVNTPECIWVEAEAKCIDKPRRCGGSTTRFYQAGWTYDNCGSCYLPGSAGKQTYIHNSWSDVESQCEEVIVPEPNRCQSLRASCEAQPKVGSCNLCYLNMLDQGDDNYFYSRLTPAPYGVRGTDEYKPNCNVFCDHTSCPPARGTCDHVTGECVCHSDFKRGFWDHSADILDDDGNLIPVDLDGSGRWSILGNCAVCLGDFFPLPDDVDLFNGVTACTLECTETATSRDANGTVTDGCGCVCDYQREVTEDYGPCMCTECTRELNLTFSDSEAFSAELPSIVRPFEPAWTDDIVAVGFQCRSKRRSLCEHGRMNEFTGECRCEGTHQDDGYCAFDSRCSFHGVYQEATGHCDCYGCWKGDKCEDSWCKNSGQCIDARTTNNPVEWRCNCLLGVWRGSDCSECPQSCQQHSHCPLQWPDSMKGRDLQDIPSKYLQCWVGEQQQCFGNWGGQLCDTCSPPASVPLWIRDDPDLAPQCTSRGEIIGCDGLPATDVHYKWMNKCDVCTDVDDGGNTQCIGCDGVLGSGTTSDSCGVCGGNGQCECVYERPEQVADSQGMLVDLVWGLVPSANVDIQEKEWSYFEEPLTTTMSAAIPRDENFDFRDFHVQRHLHGICSMLHSDEKEQLVSRGTKDCIMLEWEEYLNSHMLVFDALTAGPKEVRPCTGFSGNTPPSEACESLVAQNRNQANRTEIFELLTFPYDSEWTGYVAYAFAEDRQKTSLMGFSTSNKYSADPLLKVTWMRMRFTLPTVLHDGTGSISRYYNRWSRFTKLLNQNDGPDSVRHGDCFHWSPLWIRFFTEEQAAYGTYYALILGTGAIVAVVLIFSCCLVITLVTFLNVVGIVVFSLSYMQLAGWKLGPVEQVGMTCLVAIASEYTIHMMEGYLEYLHATQSSLLARSTSKTRALAGTLQRMGVPIAVSAFAVLIASLLLLPCDILIYRRIAEMFLMVTLISSFHGLVILPCLLLLIGPVTVLRNWTLRWLWAATVGLTILFVLAIMILADAKGPSGDELF